MLEPFVELPGTVVALELTERGPTAVLEIDGAAGGNPLPGILSPLDRDERLVEPVDGLDERCSGDREIADIRAIGSLAVVDAVDDLGQDAVDVEIALPVTVRAQIDRDTVDMSREVRAVVEIESAQEVLVGLTAAGVLHRQHAGDSLEQLGRPEHRSDQQIRAGNRALAGRIGCAEQLCSAAEDDDLLHGPCCRAGIILSHRNRGKRQNRQRQ